MIEQFATPINHCDNGLDYRIETDLSTSVMATIYTQSKNTQELDEDF